MPDAEGKPPVEEAPPPLPEGIKEPKDLVVLWVNRLKASGSARAELEKDWERWEEKANAEWEKQGGEDDDEVFINKPLAVVRSIRDQTYSRNPRYRVKPKRPNTEQYAQDLTDLMAQVVEEVNLKREGKRALHQATIIGGSWIKTWWEDDVRPIETPVSKPVMDETGQPVVDPTTGQPAVAQGIEIVPIDFGRVRVRQVDSVDVRINPEAKRVDDITYFAHRVTRRTASVKQDPRYKNAYSHLEELEPSAVLSASDHNRFGQSGYVSASTSEKYEEKDGDRTFLWEIEDLENGMKIVIAEGHEHPLLITKDDYKELLGPSGMWTQMIGEEHSKSPYGIGTMAIMEAESDEQNRIETRSLTHSAWAIPKVLVDKSKFTNEDEIANFTSGDAGSVAEVTNVEGAARVLEMPNLIFDNDKALARINAHIDEFTGSSGQQRGVAAAGAGTATQAAIISQNERVATSARIDRVEDCMAEVGRKILKLCRAYMTQEQIVRILGEDGSVTWRPMTPSDIEGEYDLSIEYGSTVQKNDIEEKQQEINFYNLVANDPIFNPIKVRKDLLIALGKTKELDEYMNQQIAMAVQMVLADMGAGQEGGGQAGPVVPMKGMPSAPRGPIGDARAGVGPSGGPAGQAPTLGQIRAAEAGASNQPKV